MLRLRLFFAVAGLAGLASCSDSTDVPSSPSFASAKTGPTVSATDPSASARDTTLDVRVLGSGYDNGSKVEFLLDGLADPKVVTNQTRYVSGRELIANITIAADAVVDFRDVAVTTSGGKKGIGAEKFQVLAMELLPGSPEGSGARDVNNSGIVVGSRTGGCYNSIPVRWDAASSVDLPIPAGYCSGKALHVNDAGTIMGVGYTAAGVTTSVRWLGGPASYAVESLGNLPNGEPSEGIAGINAAGHAIESFFNGSNSRPFWWSEGTGYLPLALPNGALGCYPEGINDLEEIAGACYFAENAGFATAVYWASPSAPPTLLPRMPGYDWAHSAQGLNSSGTIVGYAMKRSKSGSLTAPARWTRTGASWIVELLPGIGGLAGSADDVNESGWVVGSTYVTGNTKHATLWVPGKSVEDLGSLGVDSYARAINSPTTGMSGLIVGISNVKSIYQAVLWRR